MSDQPKIGDLFATTQAKQPRIVEVVAIEPTLVDFDVEVRNPENGKRERMAAARLRSDRWTCVQQVGA